MTKPTDTSEIKPHEVIIALGSNLGDRIGYFERALRLLLKDGNSMLVETSQWYQTKPVEGLEGQGFCLNGAIAIKTKHDPEKLLEQLLAIEEVLGRKRSEAKKEPRTIDLDIILYENKEVQTEQLKLPHPRFEHRNFVLCPLRDILNSKILKGKYWDIFAQKYEHYDSDEGIEASLAPSALFLSARIPS